MSYLFFRAAISFSALASILTMGSHASAEISGKASTSKSDLAETATWEYQKYLCADGRSLTYTALENSPPTSVYSYFLRTKFETNNLEYKEAEALINRVSFLDLGAINTSYTHRSLTSKIHTKEVYSPTSISVTYKRFYLLENSQGKKILVYFPKMEKNSYNFFEGIIQFNRRPEGDRMTGDNYNWTYFEPRRGAHTRTWDDNKVREFCPKSNTDFIGSRSIQLIGLCPYGEKCDKRKLEPQRILLWVVDTFYTATPGRIKKKFIAPSF